MQLNIFSTQPHTDGLVAEWLRRGLQILAPRFDSGRGLHPNTKSLLYMIYLG